MRFMKQQELSWLCNSRICCHVLTCVIAYATDEGANLNIHKCLNKHYVICFNDVTTIIMDVLCPKVVNMHLMM